MYFQEFLPTTERLHSSSEPQYKASAVRISKSSFLQQRGCIPPLNHNTKPLQYVFPRVPSYNREAAFLLRTTIQSLCSTYFQEFLPTTERLHSFSEPQHKASAVRISKSSFLQQRGCIPSLNHNTKPLQYVFPRVPSYNREAAFLLCSTIQSLCSTYFQEFLPTTERLHSSSEPQYKDSAVRISKSSFQQQRGCIPPQNHNTKPLQYVFPRAPSYNREAAFLLCTTIQSLCSTYFQGLLHTTERLHSSSEPQYKDSAVRISKSSFL